MNNDNKHYQINLASVPSDSIEVIEISQDIMDKVDIAIYGSLENARVAKIAEAKLWCSGHKINYGVYYVPDGKNKQCFKHHYRCNYCRKIVQIG